MIRDEMLKKLNELIGQSKRPDHNSFYPMSESKVYKMWMDWQALRDKLAAECCGNCSYWTPWIRVSSEPVNPGVCRGWMEGMFSITCDPENEEVFKTYEDFYCSCFKART